MKARKQNRVWEIGTGSEGSEGERSEHELTAGPVPISPPGEQAAEPAQADPEVRVKATRRRFSARYKLRILKQVDRCQKGQVGALLRREGLYWSNLQTWQRQREEGTLKGLTPKKRGPKKTEANPLAGELKKLERENRQLKRKLQRAQIMLDIQKKASELLGIPLAKLDEEEDN